MTVGHGIDRVLVRSTAREGELHDLLEPRDLAGDLARARVNDDLGLVVREGAFDLMRRYADFVLGAVFGLVGQRQVVLRRLQAIRILLQS